MIRAIRQLFEHDDPTGVNPEHAGKLRNILATLHAAPTVARMDTPGFRPHPLKGEMKGFGAVTVRANWRVIFVLTTERRTLIVSITTERDHPMTMTIVPFLRRLPFTVCGREGGGPQPIPRESGSLQWSTAVSIGDRIREYRRSPLHREGGWVVSHGLKTGTRALSKSFRSRVTTVSPCSRVVAASKRSGCE